MPTSTQSIIDTFSKYVMPNYGRYPVVITKGEGSYVRDADGKRYKEIKYFFP